MHDPSVSQSLPRLACLWGTFSPSRCQIRSTRLSLIIQLGLSSSPGAGARDLAIAIATLGDMQLRSDLLNACTATRGALDKSSFCRKLLGQTSQRQIGNRLAQPAVLELKVLQALHLLGLQPTELLAPPIIRHLQRGGPM